MENLKRVDLVFENCEVEKIPAENISVLDIDLCSTSYFYSHFGKFSSHISSKNVVIGFKNLTKEQKESVGRKDLTHIDLIFEDKNVYITVPLPSFFCYWLPNPYQINEEIEEEIYIYIYKHFSLNLLRLKILDWYRFLKEDLVNRTKNFIIHPLVDYVKNLLRIK